MLTDRMWVPLDTRVLTQNYAALVDSKSLPSTGWLGGADLQIHAFIPGMRWSNCDHDVHRKSLLEASERTRSACSTGAIFTVISSHVIDGHGMRQSYMLCPVMLPAGLSLLQVQLQPASP